MPEVSLDALNERFAIPGHVSFEAAPGGLPVAAVNNGHAAATVALLGGQVLSYQPHGHDPVLWVSKRSHFQVGRPVRGGIPVCWPWFGAHPEDPGKPFQIGRAHV
jgi:glucose-6-phosphate 1-epimerase